MDGCTVHNLSRERMSHPLDLYVGRKPGRFHRHIPAGRAFKDGYFGSPFDLSRMGREESIELYETYARHRLATDPLFAARLAMLYGHRLFCWCAPLPCHGDVLARLAAELHKEHARNGHVRVPDQAAP